MATIDLTPDEQLKVLEILKNYLSDLRLEIGDTKKKSYRDDLKDQEQMVKGIVERLEAT
ncbi:MAG: hypothetical protein P8182_19200 [Deltaproteobacteria bacterium]